MPELPEVEVLRRRLQDRLVGKVVARVQFVAERQVHPCQNALEKLLGQSIQATERRGKLICLVLEEGELVFHLRMSGSLHCLTEDVMGRHTRLMLGIADGTWLRFDDPRRFGTIHVGPPFPSYITDVAPDPLSADFDLKYLVKHASCSRRRIKSWLLDQTIVSGIGNIYADEALYRARIHPYARPCELGAAKIANLMGEVEKIFRRAIELGGSSIDWAYQGGGMQHELLVYGRQGGECANCGSVLQYSKIDKRGTTWCPVCQLLTPG